MKTIIILIFVIFSNFVFSQDTNIVSYLKEITTGSEYLKSNSVKKFKKDVYIIIQGSCSDTLKNELIKIINELNDLINPIEIYITEDIKIANVRLYFGGPDDYVKINPLSATSVKDSWGLASVFPNNGEINISLVFVDTKRTSNDSQRKHILREEITQALGFTNDSYRYPDSIFFQEWTETHYYSEIDKEIIKMFYN